MVVLTATSEPSSRSWLLCEQVWAKLLPNHLITFRFASARCIFHVAGSPNSVPTLRGSCSRCKGRCLIRVLTLVSTIFPINFRIKLPFSNVDVHFECAGSHKVWVPLLGRSIFPLKFHIKWLLRNVDFPLRGLAQNVGRGFGARHFPVHFRIKWLLWNDQLHFDSASSHKVRARVLGSIWGAAVFLHISVKRGFCEKFKCISTAQARTKCVSAFWAHLGRSIFPVNFRIKRLLWHVEVHFLKIIIPHIIIPSTSAFSTLSSSPPSSSSSPSTSSTSSS